MQKLDDIRNIFLIFTDLFYIYVYIASSKNRIGKYPLLYIYHGNFLKSYIHVYVSLQVLLKNKWWYLIISGLFFLDRY